MGFFAIFPKATEILPGNFLIPFYGYTLRWERKYLLYSFNIN